MPPHAMQQLIQIVEPQPLLRQARRWTHLRGSSGQPTQSFAMLLQPAPQRADQALFELIQALCLRAEACGGAHERRPPGEPAQTLALLFEPAPHAALQPRAEPYEGIEPFLGIGNRKFRGRGGRRRTHVRCEVGNGEIDLVTDPGDHRDGRSHDRARQALVVERPEIFQRTAASAEDQYVAFGAAAGYLERRDDFRRRLRALDGDGVDEHGRGGKAPRQYVQNVADRGTRGRGDDADPPGKARQWAFTLRGE